MDATSENDRPLRFFAWMPTGTICYRWCNRLPKCDVYWYLDLKLLLLVFMPMQIYFNRSTSNIWEHRQLSCLSITWVNDRVQCEDFMPIDDKLWVHTKWRYISWDSLKLITFYLFLVQARTDCNVLWNRKDLIGGHFATTSLPHHTIFWGWEEQLG